MLRDLHAFLSYLTAHSSKEPDGPIGQQGNYPFKFQDTFCSVADIFTSHRRRYPEGQY